VKPHFFTQTSRPMYPHRAGAQSANWSQFSTSPYEPPAWSKMSKILKQIP